MPPMLLKIVRTFIARGLTGVALIILTYYVSGRFGLTHAGFVNLTWLILLLVSMFAKYGIEYAGVKHLAVHAGNRNAAGASTFINTNAGVLLVLLTFAVPVALFISSRLFAAYPVDATDLGLFSLILLLYGMLAFMAPLHRGLSRPDASYYFDQGGVALIVIVLLAALVTEDNFITGFLTALLAATAVVAGISSWSFRNAYRRQFAEPLRLAPSPAMAALRDGFPYFVISLAEYFLFWSSLLLLSALDTSTNVGIYSVLLRTAQLTVVAMSIINAIVSPRLATLQASGKTRHLRSYISRIWKMNFVLGTLSIVAICLLAPLAFTVAGIEPGREIYLVFLFLMLPQAIKILIGPVGHIMAMSRASQHALARIASSTVLLATLFSALLIPAYGLLGAAVGCAAGLTAYHLSCLLHIRQRHGFYTFEAGTRLVRKYLAR